MERKAKASFGLLTADTLIKGASGYLFSLTLSYTGVSAGERCTIVDGTDVTGTDEVVVVFPAAHGTIQLLWPEGKEFATGIFYNKGATAGSVWAEGQYR